MKPTREKSQAVKSSSRVPVIVVAAVICTLGICALRQNAEIGELRARIAAESVHKKQSGTVKRTADEVRRDRQSTAEQVAKLKLLVAAGKDRAGRKLSPLQQAASEYVDKIRTAPAYAPFLQRESRRFVQKRYADLFSRLAVPPAILDRLKAILVETDLDPTRRNDYRELEAKVRDLLGQEEFQVYADYMAGSRMREDIAVLQSTLAATDVPALSADQSRALEQAYVEWYDHNRNPKFEEMVRDGTLDREFLTQAGRILENDQLQAFGRMKEQERTARKALREKNARPSS